MDSEQVIENVVVDENDRRTRVLMFVGHKFGIADDPEFIAERRGRYVRLTAAGVVELRRANYWPGR